MSEAETYQMQYSVSLPGVRNLPTRIACAFAANRFWFVVLLIIAPVVLLVVTMVVSERVAGFYLGWCIGFIMMAVYMSYRYYWLTVTIDTSQRHMTVSVKPGGRLLERLHSGYDVDLSTVESISYVQVGDVIIGKLHSERPLLSYPFMFPSDQFAEITQAIEAAGDATSEDGLREDISSRVSIDAYRPHLLAILAGIASLVLPGAVVITRPDLFALNALGIAGVLGLIILVLVRLQYTWSEANSI